MTSLTKNEYGYEFNLDNEKCIVIQYDANQIGSRVHVSDFEIVIKVSNIEELQDATVFMEDWYDEDAAIEMKCEEHFRKIAFCDDF